MNFKVHTISYFDKQLKRLVKKYPSLKTEFAKLVEQLEIHPTMGIPIGHDCYKIRLAITSKNKGKSGGGRVITFVNISGHDVYLLSIYDKSDQNSISDKHLLLLLEQIK